MKLVTFALAMLAGTACCKDAAQPNSMIPGFVLGDGGAVPGLTEDYFARPNEGEWFHKVVQSFFEYQKAYVNKIRVIDNTNGQEQLP